ncbi:hypothetical protein Taro_002542 [Colocasia esculenta]|uniref:Uncharacterized protein n=1 Tax=Colocasia esculenta TaxID=4460 RepID=A0A843TGP8_COLES|nr:hypothetical protein [Colocasia esculenta]
MKIWCVEHNQAPVLGGGAVVGGVCLRHHVRVSLHLLILEYQVRVSLHLLLIEYQIITAFGPSSVPQVVAASIAIIDSRIVQMRRGLD